METLIVILLFMIWTKLGDMVDSVEALRRDCSVQDVPGNDS